MKTNIKTRLLWGTSCLLGLTTVAPVQAKDSEPAQAVQAAEAPAVGDIIVTAQRRSERLQDVPVAITAVSPEIATQLGLRNMRDIQLAMPGTDFTQASGFLSLFIRGVGIQYSTPGLESPVAIYLDGAYIPRAGGVNSLLDLVDPGTIEVLRGPQGTLYGRNATGGVIRINSAAPTDKFEGRILAEYGRFDHKQIDGMLNVPVSDTLSVRFAGRFKKEDGYITNLDGTKLAAQNNYTARGRFKWEPTDSFSLSGGVEWQRSKARNYNDELLLGAPTCYVCQSTGQTPGGFYEGVQTDTGPYYNRMFRADLRADLSLGDFDLSSTTTYFTNFSEQYADNDFNPENVFIFAVPRNGGKSYSQEIQVTSNLEGPFNYLFGVNYFYDKSFLDIALTGSAYDFALTGAGSYPRNNANVKTQSVSAFVEGTYKLTDQIKVTAGGRYTYDERDLSVTNSTGFQLFGAPAAFNSSASFRAFTPRFVLAWDNGPLNVYYSFTRGFKAGGFSTPAPFPGNAINPEKVFNHEVGIKNSALGGKLRSSLAVFYYKNKGLQQQIIDATGAGTRTENVGAAEGYGAELEINGDPMRGLVIGASAAYLHAEYESYPNASQICFDPTGTLNTQAPGATLYPCSIDLSGTRVPHAPRITASLNGSYTFDIGSWRANLAGVAQYRSRFLFWPGAGGPLGLDQQKGYVVANFSGYVSPPGDQLRLGFYLDNAFNKRYTTNITTGAPYGVNFNAAKPRTYGVRAEYRF
ncbi:TonB-dependent receptor [Sphingobium tyrosinilyticum]|uniref:TonB-dependent receptor n=1 Tax=Sphingobium tyrosinilyticum TaxID=2715436 RepID=A0ABV9F0D5_9SPHN